MVPLLLILSLETLCLGTVLALVFEWWELRKSERARKQWTTLSLKQILVSLSLGFLLAPSVLSLLGIMPALLGAGPGTSNLCATLGGGWVHDAFPKNAPWLQFVWQALAMSVEMFLFLTLASRSRIAMIRRHSAGDVAQQFLIHAKTRVAKKSLAWAVSVVLVYHWLSVAIEGVRRLSG
jgi:hypothetical protein